MSNTKFYGLTGGIGAGKSTVAKLFSVLNVPVLDLDKVGHILLEEDKKVIGKLLQIFGQSILNTDKSINRKSLAKLAFSSATNTEKLNETLHPAIVSYEDEWRKDVIRNSEPTFAIIEASVLIESGGVSRMDGLIIVLADLELREQRVLKRGNQSKTNFNTIVQRQCTDIQRINSANFILKNNGSIKSLTTQINSFIKQQ